MTTLDEAIGSLSRVRDGVTLVVRDPSIRPDARCEWSEAPGTDGIRVTSSELGQVLYCASLTEPGQLATRFALLERFASRRAELARLSIRGRMAQALECFEALTSAGVIASGPALEKFVEQLWVFTHSHDLGKWEWHTCEAVSDVMSTAPPVPVLIELLVQEIGRSNLYGAITGYGVESVVGVCGVECAAMTLGVVPPAQRAVRGFGFDEWHGWGKGFTRGDWMAS